MDDRHYLLGTAGHVDHGKTELIRVLTGIETDRLKEEKQRGISIELGFASLTLPSGRQVGIIDVPGHERFIRQMLAGATGMDGVLLVIAADEGIMPQTREHLDILTLLGVSRGIVVINKIDLVDDEWLELIQAEINEGLTGTLFANAPVYLVSAHTGEGIPELKTGIDQLLTDAESKIASGPIRLPLDRVFSIQGFGTVVTGTLHNGTIRLGQELAIEPGYKLAKVRSLQVHNEKVESAFAGQRVAVNLAGVNVYNVEKGAVLTTPGAYPVGNILDLKLRNLASMDKSITQRQRVRFHIGTVEALGRVHLLEHEELLPGQEGYAQILLEEPVVAVAGDRFVIRFYSPAFTIGGGKILGIAEYKKKRFKETVLAQLKIKDQGDPLVLLERELHEPHTVQELSGSFHWEQSEIQSGLQQLKDSGQIEIWKEENSPLFWAHEAAEHWRDQLNQIVQSYQKEFPLRGGISREELKVKLGVKWTQRRWQNVLELGAEHRFYRLTGSKVSSIEDLQLPESLTPKLNCLKNRWQIAGLMPPELEAGAQECGINKGESLEFASYLVEQGEWVTITGLYFNREVLRQAQVALVDLITQNKEVAVVDVRELWGISRKYAVPLLEYFDQQKLTKRQGDKRVLNR
ncbi:selenocysteine-specific translation elongation factor [Desulfitobacterium sp.]|uniref:selenocysteine-specific translation elongation factor n=1 Tax=Desulfitobacterium sp. TaxID=49981 RepID=UPI002BC6A93F|nr:selenocysteine-specific translation elongation factor [Desulfitobacterium sp.]HVJ49122.1 selenocysteine-specific translation elongation factor [Desulfitobacterium sp.]